MTLAALPVSSTVGVGSSAVFSATDVAGAFVVGIAPLAAPVIARVDVISSVTSVASKVKVAVGEGRVVAVFVAVGKAVLVSVGVEVSSATTVLVAVALSVAVGITVAVDVSVGGAVAS